jgi:hypothetical protein
MAEQVCARVVEKAPTNRPRVPVALPPGAMTLLGGPSPKTGGLTWAGRYPHVGAAIVALVRRALSVPEGVQ